ncbi:MAG: FMN-binding protein [Candidatus Izemoplasma sp.]|nr:FMN-binding protein [Candidatus Izemoplasma sp.]
MLDKLKVAIVLVIIGALSGFFIWGVNAITSPVIEENTQKRELALYEEMFDLTGEFTLETKSLDGVLTKEVIIYDSNGQEVGRAYQGYDMNNYGDVTVLVGVVNNTITDVVIQSTSNTVTFVNTIEKTYLPRLSDQSLSDVSYDSKTGATYTYTSVKTIVQATVDYIEGGETNE